MARGASSRPHTLRYARTRIVITALACVLGLAAIGFDFAPASLQIQTHDSLVQALSTARVFAPDHIPLLAGAALLLLALASLLIRRRHARETSGPVTSTSVAPISVYLDLENQQFSGDEVKPFIGYLRERIREYTGGERADLFFYCDASNLANTAAYQALHSYGFRPVDVPHRRFNEAAAQRGDANVVRGNLKNFVDMELALHAYRRALVDAQPRHIILITSDHDFIPLIRRLRELGHEVHLWARDLTHYMKALDSTLGVHAYVFGDQFRRSAAETRERNATQGEPGAIGVIHAPPPPTRPVTKQARAASDRRNGKARSTAPAVASNATIGEAIDATFRALAHTRRAFEKVPPPKATPTSHLYTSLGNMEMNVLARLGYGDPEGYTGKRRVGYWLDQLVALGVLSEPERGDLPDHGPVDPATAEHALLGFLRFELCPAIAHAAPAMNGRLSLNELCSTLANAPAGAPDPVSALRLLFTSGTGNAHLRHMRYLCQCATRYGMLRYAAISDTEIMAPVVIDAGIVAEAATSLTGD